MTPTTQERRELHERRERQALLRQVDECFRRWARAHRWRRERHRRLRSALDRLEEARSQVDDDALASALASLAVTVRRAVDEGVERVRASAGLGRKAKKRSRKETVGVVSELLRRLVAEQANA